MSNRFKRWFRRRKGTPEQQIARLTGALDGAFSYALLDWRKGSLNFSIDRIVAGAAEQAEEYPALITALSKQVKAAHDETRYQILYNFGLFLLSEGHKIRRAEDDSRELEEMANR